MLRRVIQRGFCQSKNSQFYKLYKLDTFTKAEDLEVEVNNLPKDSYLLKRYIAALHGSGQHKKAFAEYMLRRNNLEERDFDSMRNFIMSLYGPLSTPQHNAIEVNTLKSILFMMLLMGLPLYYILKYTYEAITAPDNDDGKDVKNKSKENTASNNNGKGINLIGSSFFGSGAIKPEANLKERFKDVIGINEFRSELEEIVDYLQNPKKYTSVGASFPKGILLSGPPGTGKTLIARAIAGEAKCSFFYKSGSEFDQMYRGTGKENVKKLFAAAKAAAPSIIFIDEIDSLAGNRSKQGRVNTINQLLTELDGFQKNDNVMFIAATNVEDSLDPAIMRSGRIDKVIRIPLPDIGGREKIIEYYLSKIKHNTVDSQMMAKRTIGFSGADLKNYINTAILHAVRSGKTAAETLDFDYSYDRIQMGVRRKNPLLNKDKRLETAVRHIGQAVAAYYTEGSKKFYKVTILPSGNTLGHISMVPSKDELSSSRKNVVAQMDVAMAGRAAEEIYFGEERISTACSRELEKAANLVYFYVRDMGMANDRLFINAEPDKMSDSYRYKTDALVQDLLGQSLDRTKRLISSKRWQMDMLVKCLIEKETLTFEEFETILTNGRL